MNVIKDNKIERRLQPNSILIDVTPQACSNASEAFTRLSQCYKAMTYYTLLFNAFNSIVMLT